MRPLWRHNAKVQAPNQHRLRAGDRVVVRSETEILATLDADGTLDGLPFMPEMREWCGKSFLVQRRAEQVCIDFIGPGSANRPFPRADVVFLEDLRCDGAAHGGCARGCKVFWKEAWLRRADAGVGQDADNESGSHEPAVRLRTMSDERHYFCQSTQLHSATVRPPGNTKLWRGRMLVHEVRNGDRTTLEAIRLVARWARWTLLRAAHGDGWLRGDRDPTPTAELGLQPGDRVRIKSRDQIVATLDSERSNRGLKIGAEMTRYCGTEAVVRARVPRMINERTGEMHELTNAVSLRHGRNGERPDSECLCSHELGDCPRGELMFWREIWLEPLTARGATSANGTEPQAADAGGRTRARRRSRA
jgi:hypothetical protein